MRGLFLKGRKMSQVKKAYTKGEEIFNSISHGVGTLLAIVGTTLLLTLAALDGNVPAVIACALYGFSLIVMYAMSTLYHALPYPKAKKVFQVLDHASIYLLIAGTYTPITLVALRGSSRGMLIFAVVWVAALLGIVFNAIGVKRFRKIEWLLYLAMGWAVVWDFPAVAAAVGKQGLILLLSGGLCYTVGIIFYKMKSIRFMHGIWHLFVVSGSVLHYLCILFCVL